MSQAVCGGGDERCFGEGGGEMNSESQAEKGKRRTRRTGTLSATARSHRPCFVFLFFSAELGMLARSYPFIDQRFVSARLIHVDASAEW